MKYSAIKLKEASMISPLAYNPPLPIQLRNNLNHQHQTQRTSTANQKMSSNIQNQKQRSILTRSTKNFSKKNQRPISSR